MIYICSKVKVLPNRRFFYILTEHWFSWKILFLCSYLHMQKDSINCDHSIDPRSWTYVARSTTEFCFKNRALGSMLWSQFSAIFDDFRRKKLAFFSKTYVMITIFAKASSRLSKTSQFFRWIFRWKYFKNHNIGPRPLLNQKIGFSSTIRYISNAYHDELSWSSSRVTKRVCEKNRPKKRPYEF
jgi:hypothetical protein